jgi:hypothetical protein
MRNNKRPPKKSTRTAQYKRSDRPIYDKTQQHNMFWKNYRCRAKRLLGNAENPHRNAAFLKAREFE